MNKICLGLFSTIAVAVMGGVALAADLYVEPPAVVVDEVTSDWTGPYIGIQAGVVSLTTVEDYDPSYYTPEDPYYELGATGGTVGLFAGFDYQIDDMFVLGLSGEVNYDNVAIANYGVDDYLTLDWDAALKARAGMLINPTTLLYGMVGYSVAGFAFTEEYDDNLVDDTVSGWLVGVGLETEVAEQLFVRGEASATFYDDLTVEYQDEPWWVITPTVVKATLGLAYKF
jgi:outer membrane immunogenic protein